MKRIRHYLHLARTDKSALRFQLWMVYNRYKITIIKWFFTRYAAITGNFLTVHKRPVSKTRVHTWSDELTSEPSIAIILQGPLVTAHDFTLETVLIYRTHYPKSHIIVSTWQSESADVLGRLRAIGAHVIENIRPDLAGIGNVNLQLVTTQAGLQKARELGAEFVYKTRSDQRMYAVNMNHFLVSLLKTFPPTGGYVQKYRIAASGCLSLKYTPYLITDMFQFGHIDDMLLYWSAPFENRSQPAKDIRTVQDVIDEKINESRLCASYLERLGRLVAWTIADSWAAYADHFVIVDRETLDLFWHKYDYYKECPNTRYDGIGNDQLLTFAEWLILYSNRGNIHAAPDSGLNLNRNAILPPPSVNSTH